MHCNPFIVGSIVSGENFLGREEIFKKIRKNIFLNNEHSPSIILTGLPRMGKTSLACKCIEDKKKLNLKGIYPCFCNMGSQINFMGFIYSMVKQIRRSYKEAPFFDGKLESAFSFFDKRPADCEREDIIFALEELFDILGQEKKTKTVVVLDEFDSASTVFENNLSNFHVLRNLIINPDNRFTLFMISRRDITAIEETGGLPVGSTFANSVHRMKLQGFNEKELEIYFKKIQTCGVILNEEQKRQVLYYAGRSPYLLSAIGHELLNDDKTTPDKYIDIDSLILDFKNDMDKYFISLLSYMQREQVYKDMVQIFIGPRYDITSKDIVELIDRGYLYQEERAEGFNDPMTGEKLSYQTISEYFIEFLLDYYEENEKSEGFVTWIELAQTEKFLRKVIQDAMEMEFGKENWQEALKSRGCEEPKDAFFNATMIENFMKTHLKRFPNRKGFNILKFVGINSLTKIIIAYWDKYFKKIFNPPYTSEDIIQSDFTELHRVRNPLAHVFAECLTDMDREKVNMICNRIEEVAIRLKKEGIN